LPLVSSIILLVFGFYELQSVGCWIRKPLNRFLFWYMHQLIVMIFSVVIFCMVIYRIKRINSNSQGNQGKLLYYQVYIRIFYYLIIFAIVFITEAVD